MTDSTAAAAPPVSPAPVPTGIRVASTLCWLVGILTIGIALAVGIPALQGGNANVVRVAISLLAGIAVCAAGYLVRRQRKSGALLVVLAWAAPTLIGLANGTGARGSVLLFAAMVALFLNWKHLR